MTDEQRQYFLRKYTTKITFDTLEQDLNNLKSEDEEEEEQNIYIKYNKTKIDEIIKKYGFAENFNFFDENNIEPIVKDQKDCSCCWSHSATTALSYRYQKLLNKNVNLSPQYAISCYIKDCGVGNTILDAQLDLIVNGTVTEDCFPFSSGHKIIPDCIDKCVNNETMTIYKAKNAYLTRDYYSEETFYDIVALNMDQLHNYGPVVSGIDLYQDFVNLAFYKENCPEYIYRYDGNSDDKGGHALTIVGYGLKDDRYYWIAQNSWGSSFCDRGFIKIEFGQVGIEQVSFVEPYLPNNKSIPNEINLSFKSLDALCELDIKVEKPLTDVTNAFVINFEKENNDINNNEEFKFICGKVKNIDKEQEIKCYYEERIPQKIGTYKFKQIESLGTENKFVDNGSFQGQIFNFYSKDAIFPLYFNSQLFFVSEEGSQIIFKYEQFENNNILNQIYSDINNNKNLRNCNVYDFREDKFIYCKINKDELDYFEYNNKANDNPVVFISYCGKVSSKTIVYRLNKTEYPVFRIKRAYMDDTDKIGKDTEIKVVANVEGSISNYNKNQEFIIFGHIIYDINTQIIYSCNTTVPKNGNKEHEFICKPNINVINFKFDSLYFEPLIIPLLTEIPYEIILSETIQVQKQKKESLGKYLKISKVIIFLILLLI